MDKGTVVLPIKAQTGAGVEWEFDFEENQEQAQAADTGLEEDTESEKEEGPEQVNIWEQDNGEDFDVCWAGRELGRSGSVCGSLDSAIVVLTFTSSVP